MKRVGAQDLKGLCACPEAVEFHQQWAEVYGDDEREWSRPVREMIGESIERANALDAVRREALTEIARHGSVVFGCQHEKWALLAPDPEDNSLYRVTWFDGRGFIGHSAVATPAAGVEEAFDTHRIHIAPRDTLDRIAGTEQFLEGCRRLEEARRQWLECDAPSVGP